VAISMMRDEGRRWLVARATGSLAIDDVVGFLKTARADPQLHRWPLLFDARSCTTSMTAADVAAAVAVVRDAKDQGRAHVAIIADNDQLYSYCVRYETHCHDLGVRVIRVFRQYVEAERWLAIVSSARELER
jgi:hypothetical protein